MGECDENENDEITDDQGVNNKIIKKDVYKRQLKQQ